MFRKAIPCAARASPGCQSTFLANSVNDIPHPKKKKIEKANAKKIERNNGRQALYVKGTPS